MIKDMSFGSLFRELRMKNRITLRQYCLARDFDSGNISKLERNLIAPPQTYRQLMKYISGLEYNDLEYDLLKTAAINHHLARALRKFEAKP